jgi:hypothetical protein
MRSNKFMKALLFIAGLALFPFVLIVCTLALFVLLMVDFRFKPSPAPIGAVSSDEYRKKSAYLTLSHGHPHP